MEDEAMRVTIEGYEPGTLPSVSFDIPEAPKMLSFVRLSDSSGVEKEWLVVERTERAGEVSLRVVGEDHEWFRLGKGR
jgi:hypothetical protein